MLFGLCVVDAVLFSCSCVGLLSISTSGGFAGR